MLKKLTLSLLFVGSGLLAARADNVEVDGIKYITDASTHTASVTYNAISHNTPPSENTDYYVGNITIPPTITVGGETYTVTAIGERAFRTCTKLTGVTLPNTITTIGYCGFEHCTSLCEVVLPESVKTISGWAFANCSSSLFLTLTDVESIEYPAFENTSAAILNFLSNTPPSGCSNGAGNIVIVPDAAEDAYKSALASVNCLLFTQSEYARIPQKADETKTDYEISTTALANKSNLQKELVMANGCDMAKYIQRLKVIGSINNYDLAVIRTLTNLINLDLSEASIENNTIVASGLRDLSNLQTVVLPSTLTTIGDYAFYGCTSLQSFGDLPKLTSIGENAFNGCSSLQSLGDLPKLTSIGDDAFYGCSSLQSLGDLSSLITIGNCAFSRCASLQALGDLPALTTIGMRAFSDTDSQGTFCTALRTIGDMPKLKTIGIGAFSRCSALQSIGELAELTTIGVRAFEHCSALNAIGDLPSLTSIDTWAFLSCTSLKTIGDLPALKIIGQRAFRGCSALLSIGNMPNLIEIGDYALSGCSAIESIGDMPALITIGEYVFSGDYQYSSCSSLTTIGAMPSITTIGNNAFNGCSSLQTLADLPKLTSIGQNAFSNCKTLQSLGNMPSLATIGANAFSGTGITDLSLPATLSNVTTSAFSAPMVVHFAGATPPTFSGTSIGTTICVPAESVEAYREALPDMSISYIIVDGLTNYDVSVSALEDDSDVLNKVNEGFESDMATNVINLKVTGTINSYDILVFRNKMLNLRKLDLSDATISGSSYEYYTGNHTEDNIIGANMFRGLKLTEIILPDNVTKIGRNAFDGCQYLTKVKLPANLKTIENGAFSACSNLQEITIPEGVTSIGVYGFNVCRKLEKVTLPQSLTTLGDYAFNGCSSLKEVIVPPSISIIPYRCFYGCFSLASVSLPPTLNKIDQYAFSGCNELIMFRIPAGVSSIGNEAIPNTVRDVYTYTIQPTSITQETFGSDTFLKATLHVPETSEKLYYWDTQWSQFQNITNFNEPYSYFYLDDKDLKEDPDTPRLEGETDEETGDKKNPDADLGQGSGLIVDGDNSQDLGNVDLEHDGTGNGATIIGGDSNTSESGGNVNIDMLNIKIPVLANKWYFFAFPFDIEMKNIKFEGQMVWRYYDGEWRAMHGSGSWKDVTGDKLERGHGYIFQGSKRGTLTLSIPKASFNAKDWLQELKQYLADKAQDASWNFIGNPFQSYYELADLGFDGPITWWNPNSNSYEAFSPQDDDLSMHPFMAFFVQKPEGKDWVEFFSKYRESRNQKDDPNHRSAARKRRAARRAANTTERKLINLTVTDGTNSDRTRVVFNSSASDAYEVGVDASKFVSADAPQIYTLDAQGVRYAINERPTGNGVVRLGFYAPAAGTYTIGCTRNDCPVTLKDCQSGITVTLEAGETYEFTASKGYDDSRFVINARGGEESGIGAAEAAEATDAIYYQINGTEADASRRGLMIEVKGNEAKKVIRK